MIELTRLNGQKLYLNCDLLKSAETAPDTVLTLVTGDKIVVRESCAEVIALALAWRAGVLRTAWPDAGGALTALMLPPSNTQPSGIGTSFCDPVRDQNEVR